MRAEPSPGGATPRHPMLNVDLYLDNDEWIVYPDVDRDEDVVYAYHAINDK